MLNFTSVTTTDGVRLNVVETGNLQGPPIVFIHGNSQSWLSWIAQLADPALRARFRLIAFDLRGHGSSQGSQVALDAGGAPFAPMPDSAYTASTPQATAALWAGDLDAVIRGLNLLSPTVIGWSYGGVVLLDYIALRGSLGAIGKAVLLASSPVALPIGTPNGGADTVLFPAAFSTLAASIPVNVFTGHTNTNGEIAAGLTSFVELCFQDDLGGPAPTAAAVQGATGFNLFAPPAVRLAVITRSWDYRPALADLSAAEKARVRAYLPMGDKVVQEVNTSTYWQSAGLIVDAIANEGHLYHYRNAADFNTRLAAFAAPAA